MPKGYWIAQVDVNSDEGYKPYAAANAAIFKKFGGRFIIRAGKSESMEDNARSRNVVIEFPDYASALACYRSPEYQANIKVRQPHSTDRKSTRLNSSHLGIPDAGFCFKKKKSEGGQRRGLREGPSWAASRTHVRHP